MKTAILRWFGFLLAAAACLAAAEPEQPAIPPAARERLERDGFCIAETGGSMFDIYNQEAVPPFITSDSLLAQYHVLLLRTMEHDDSPKAERLEVDFRRGWKRLEELADQKPEADPAVCAAALRRARMVCGTALALLDPSWHADQPELEKEITAEAKRVTDAVAAPKPAWLGPPEPVFKSLDYAACKPVARWAKNEKSQQHFRAIRFLQMVPFRLSRQEELFSACYLQFAIIDETDICGLLELAASDSAIGPLAFMFVGWAFLEGDNKGTGPLRKMLGENLTYVPDFPDKRSHFPHLIQNLIADCPMTEADMDTRLVAPIAFPDSVLMQTAMDQQSDKDSLPDPLLVAGWLGDGKAMEAVRKRFSGSSDEFPARKRALPHPYSLEHIIPLIDGYYNAMQALMSGPEKDAPEFMFKDAWRLKNRQTVLASWAITRNTFALESGRSYGFGGGPPSYPGFVEPVPEFYQRLGHLAKQMAESYGYDSDKDSARKWFAWFCFARTCQQLEAMAHKQLRGIEWNEIECDFIGAYCLYLPQKDQDDQPRAAAVARSGVSGTTLIAASGLNRVIWVNYPWHGKKVLCKGAVMTFYSFPAPDPLTDKEWDTRLHATPAPPQPDWLKPIMGHVEK